MRQKQHHQQQQKKKNKKQKEEKSHNTVVDRVCAGMASAMTMAMALALAIVVMMTNGPKGTAGDGCERAGMITKCAALPCTHK